jgi:hypothetical protein
MKGRPWVVSLSLIAFITIPALGFGQPTAPGPTPPPMGPVAPPSGVAFGSLTPGPDPNLYGIPKTTAVGMPPFSVSPVPVSTPAVSAASGPMTLSDCASDHWRTYPARTFKSQSGCEAWVKRHGAGATAGTRRATTPRPRRTPAMRMVTPNEATTPSSSITPFLNPTPLPR